MSDPDKNFIDIILGVATMVGAIVVFVISLFHYRRGQAWQRAEQLDKFIEKFETDELLKLSTVVLDWSDRDVKFQGRHFEMRNDDALLALRDHMEIRDKQGSENQGDSKNLDMFPGEQAHIRDAYDALLAFFNRLELSISTKFIDAAPAKAYFSYWLTRFMTFDRHPDKHKVLEGVSPESMVAKYIMAYGEPASIEKLCDHFGVKATEFAELVEAGKVTPPPAALVSAEESQDKFARRSEG